MKAVVLKNGALIPKRLQRDAALVDMRREKAGRVVITPSVAEVDPICCLGSMPVGSRLFDASSNHDEYIHVDL